MLGYVCKEDPNQYSPLVLAYLGDAVFEIYVRTMLISKGNAKVDKLHGMATGYVNAASQSAGFKKIEPMLTEEEMAVWRRGRNAKSTPTKNAGLGDYHTATGLEALIGYIYLKGDQSRLDEIMNMIFG